MDKAKQNVNIAIQLLAYNTIWFLSIILAAKDYVYQGLMISTIIIVIQVISHKLLKGPVRLLLLFSVFLSLLGLLVDSALQYFNLFEFSANPFQNTFASPFLIGIWLSFSIMFYSILKHWFTRYRLIGIFSLIGFPLAYYFGVRLEAAEAIQGIFSYITLGLVWMIILPSFCFLFLKVAKNDH